MTYPVRRVTDILGRSMVVWKQSAQISGVVQAMPVRRTWHAGESAMTLEYRCTEGQRTRSGRSWGLILGPEYQDLLMEGSLRSP